MVTSNRFVKFIATRFSLSMILWGNVTRRSHRYSRRRIVSPIKNEERVIVKGSTSPFWSPAWMQAAYPVDKISAAWF